MNSKNKNNLKLIMSFLAIFIIMFAIPLTSSLNDKVNKIDKVDKGNKIEQIKNIKLDKQITNNKNKYSNDYVKIESDIKNTINTEKTIINKNYISVLDYDKKDNSNYEITFITNNSGVLYDIYRSDETNITKSEVKEKGKKYTSVLSKNGEVTFKVSGFSTYILSITDFTIPFYNTASINMKQYYGDDVDHYYFTFSDKGNTNSGNEPWIIIDDYESYTYHRGMSLNSDTFEISAYKLLGDSYLDMYVYDSICSSELTSVDSTQDCFYNGVDVSAGSEFGFNSIKVWSCDQTGIVTQTEDTNGGWVLSGNGCVQEDDFYINTPSTEHYYLSGIYETGLYPDMVEYFSFNNYLSGSGEELIGRWLNTAINNGATYTEINDFKAGVYDGGAFDFDGINDYISLPTDVIPSTSGSISLWFYMNSFNSGEENVLFSTGISTANDPWSMLRVGSSSNPYIYMGVQGNSDFYGDTSILINNWYHVVITSDGTTGKIYVNGAEETLSGINNGQWFDDISFNMVSIGVLGRISNYAEFNGIIDEVGIFDRALTSDEIDYLYNSGVGRNFYNLNTPAVVIPQNLELTFDVGISSIYMYNFFNYDTAGSLNYEYDLYYYDYVSESYVTLPDGMLTTNTEGYGFANDDGILDVDYFGLEEQAGFDGWITARDKTTGSEEIYYLSFIFPEVLSITPPYQIKPLTSTYDANINNDIDGNILYNINSHYGNYSKVEISYYDEILNDNISYLVELENTIYTGNSITEFGNLSIDLFSENSNVFLNISSVENKIFDGVLFINMSNSAGYLSENINIKSNSNILNTIELIKPLDNLSIGLGCSEEENINYDLHDYFGDEINDYNITFYFKEENYTSTIPLNSHANFDNSDTYTFPDLLKIYMYYNEILKFETFNNTQNISVFVNAINDTTEKEFIFYIEISEEFSCNVDNTNTEIEYSYVGNWFNQLKNIFPDSEDLSNFQKLMFVIFTMIIASFLIIISLYKILPRGVVFITIFANILIFLLYATIHYVSIGFIILITLISLGLITLKARNL